MMTKPNTSKTKTSAPMAEPQGDNTKPADGEPTGPNMTKQEYDALTGTASQEEDLPKTETEKLKDRNLYHPPPPCEQLNLPAWKLPRLLPPAWWLTDAM